MIPYGRQDVNDADIAAVINILQSDWLTQGPCVPRFEAAVAHRVGAEYGVAVNSGTSALHIACLALNLGPGDWLWTSPNTFVASANCGLYCGAHIDFVDIDPQTYNMSVQALSEKLEQAKKIGKLPKVLVPVHFAGQSCDMEAIHKLSKQYGFKIIEDASHAIGGSYKNLPIGCGRYSDVTVFSFHPVKLITTGEGGMAVTNDSKLAASMESLRSHGITRDPKKMQNIAQGEWYYEQIELGLNYRMTDMQAALGLSQLERLDDFIAQRHQLVSVYTQGLSDLPLTLPYQAEYSHSAFHLYVIQVDPENSPIDRKALFHHLREAEIGVNVHYIPVHTQPYYQELGFKLGDFPESESYYNHAISLPIYPLLQEHEQLTVINTLRGVLND